MNYSGKAARRRGRVALCILGATAALAGFVTQMNFASAATNAPTVAAASTADSSTSAAATATDVVKAAAATNACMGTYATPQWTDRMKAFNDSELWIHVFNASGAEVKPTGYPQGLKINYYNTTSSVVGPDTSSQVREYITTALGAGAAGKLKVDFNYHIKQGCENTYIALNGFSTNDSVYHSTNTQVAVPGSPSAKDHSDAGVLQALSVTIPFGTAPLGCFQFDLTSALSTWPYKQYQPPSAGATYIEQNGGLLEFATGGPHDAPCVIPPAPVTCPTGQHMDSSKNCVPDTPTPPTCPSGQHMDTNKNCVPDTPPTCPTGQHMDTSNHCVPNTCPSGQVMQGTTCVTPPTTPPVRCSAPKVLIDNVCVDAPPVTTPSNCTGSGTLGGSQQTDANGCPIGCPSVTGTTPTTMVNGCPQNCPSVTGTTPTTMVNGCPQNCPSVTGTTPTTMKNGCPVNCPAVTGTTPTTMVNGCPQNCPAVSGTTPTTMVNGCPVGCSAVTGNPPATYMVDGCPTGCPLFSTMAPGSLPGHGCPSPPVCTCTQPTVTTPATTPPVQVLAEVVTPIAAAPLARTGFEVKPYLALGFLLIGIGGACALLRRRSLNMAK